jgi:hypothetical protein
MAVTAVPFAIVAVVMGVTLAVKVVMLMRMGMVVVVGVSMGMAVCMPIVGMLVSMGMAVLVIVSAAEVVMVNMHRSLSFFIFFYYNINIPVCQSIYFALIPHQGLHKPRKCDIMRENRLSEEFTWPTFTNITITHISMPTASPTPTVMSTRTRRRF